METKLEKINDLLTRIAEDINENSTLAEGAILGVADKDGATTLEANILDLKEWLAEALQLAREVSYAMEEKA